MPKSLPSDQRRDRQLLLRLTAAQVEWLEAAAFLERVTVNEYVFRLVSAHIQALRGVGPVRAAIEVRRGYDAGSQGITNLRDQ